MSAVATANATLLLTSLGVDAGRLGNVRDGIELVIEEFDVWQDRAISAAPVMGTVLCFRDTESEAIAA
jgi:hypothetical protein